MNERKPCKQPGCGCDYEKFLDEDEDHDDQSYCTDTIKPLLCEVPEIKCKYPGVMCPHVNYYENDQDKENPLCYAMRDGVTECPLKVYEPEGETWSLQEAIKKSPYWNLRGFLHYKDKLIVDEKIIRTISSWAGDCTEPNSGIYNDPEAMFNALNLIYKIIEECEAGSVTVENKDRFDREPETVHLNQIESISSDKERKEP